MHKTEISHINKRHATQIEMKDMQIESLDQKLKEQKTKTKDLEAKLIQKESEFEFYVKEENLRVSSLHFKHFLV